MSIDSSSVMTNIGLVFVKGNPSEQDLVAVREAINKMHAKSKSKSKFESESESESKPAKSNSSEGSFSLWNDYSFRLGLTPRSTSSSWRSSMFLDK